MRPARTAVDRTQLPAPRQLWIAAIVATAVAAILGVAVVMPAELGRDPTGLGRPLRLTEMGEIKQRLAAEARADSLSDAHAPH